MNKLIILGMLFAILLVPIASASVEYTESKKTECYDSGRCYITKYGGVRFAQDSTGEWVDASDVLSISKYQDDITFNYDGIKGDYSITFEAGVHYNGNYYSFTDVKALKPAITFDFPVTNYDSHKKYDVVINNLDELDMDKIDNITLTYKSHEGFTLDQLTAANKRFKIKNFIGLYFDDLLNKHPVDIKMDERRLYIANITDNIVDGTLILDPNLLLETESIEITDDGRVIESLPDTNSAALGILVIARDNTPKIQTSYIKFNMTDLPATGITITNANLSFAIETNQAQNFSIGMWAVESQDWAEETLTWNIQPTVGALISPRLDNRDYTNRMGFDVTSFVVSEHAAGENNVSFCLNASLYDVAGDVNINFHSKESGSDPFLNISYDLTPEHIGVHINVYSSTTNVSVTSWSVTFNNGSTIYTDTGNNNPTEIGISSLPIGTDVNVTFFKAGWFNSTYIVSLNDSHTENMTAFLTPYVNLTNCTSTDTAAALIFRLRSAEYPFYFINGSFDATFTTWTTDSTDTNYNFSLGMDNTFHLCVTAGESLQADATIEYTDWLFNHSLRQYYFVNTTLTNTTVNTVDLYLLNESISSYIKVIVENTEGIRQTDVVIKAQRYYVGEDVFRTVVMGKTNYDGYDNIYLKANDVFYRFVLEKDGEVITILEPFKIVETEITLKTSTDTLGEYFSYINNFYWTCDTNEATNYTSCTYSETSGKFVNACLIVREKNIINNTEICNTCDTSSSSTLLCYLNANVDGKSFYYELIGHFTETDFLFESGWLSFGEENVWGLVGVLVALLMVILAALLGSYSPSIAVAIITIALIMCYIAGLIPINVGALIGIIAVGVLMVYKMRFA